MKVYISGPMTGLADFNFPAFDAAALALRSQGYRVTSPAELSREVRRACGEREPRREDYMRADIRALTRCDAIYLLRGWQGSRGAQLEYEIANAIGLKVFGQEGVGA